MKTLSLIIQKSLWHKVINYCYLGILIKLSHDFIKIVLDITVLTLHFLLVRDKLPHLL